ncbi:MAG: ATP-binding protein [Bacteroidia bacterium]
MTTSADNLREAFFDKAQESLAIFDKDLNFIDVNQALVNSLNLTKEEIVGKNVRELSPGIEKTERYQSYLEVIRTGNPVVLDEVRMHPSLGNFVSRISIFKVGEGLGLSAVNITDLNDATEELETFIYRSSHDMRAPIASILGLINVADSDMKDIATARNYFTIIKQQAERLDGILQRLVETTRIRQNEKILHLIDFQQLIQDTLKSFAFAKGFKEIRIEQDIALTKKFYSDKSLLISLFQNLIDNAIKYKKENYAGAFLKISVTDEDKGVKIIFADNGIGIADDLQKKVFNMFFRATDQASGSGLGLYTVKHCIRKLGGHISMDSTENIGTIFTIYLPGEKLERREE